jgi:Plasmid pRiA4b ORF-3-like protein
LAAEANGSLCAMSRDRRHLASVPALREADAGSPPSRRRPRRDEIVRYRLRVELTGTDPVLWRRVELTSDLFLDEVHDALQTAFGWTNSHLHEFGSGPEYRSQETERYLCPFELEDAGPGVPEEEVRLDEVLADPGDQLFYVYDFGDHWEHVIELEAIAPRDDTAPRAVCLDGQRDGPPEDCGSVPGYEMVSAAADPSHRNHDWTVAEFYRMYGFEFDAASHGPVPFQVKAVNDTLAGRFPPGVKPERKNPPDVLPAPLTDLLAAVREGWTRRELRSLIGAALDGKPDVDSATASGMVRPYAWLLDRVGDVGIRLTSAGYLPPAHVAAATKDLGLSEEWIGKGNRENMTIPVLLLRETATRMGLLRKRNGMLLRTAAGTKLRTDPVALWWHIAERMPPASTDRCETQAGLILLIAMAAEADAPLAITGRILRGIGWRLSDGTALTGTDISHACRDTSEALRRLGAVADDPRHYGADIPTPQGALFAQAAIST